MSHGTDEGVKFESHVALGPEPHTSKDVGFRRYRSMRKRGGPFRAHRTESREAVTPEEMCVFSGQGEPFGASTGTRD